MKLPLTEKLALVPFLRIVLPLCTGIVVYRWVEGTGALIVSITGMIYLGAWLLRRSSAASAWCVAALFATGILLAMWGTPQAEVPQGKRLIMIAEVEQTPLPQGRWQQTTARIGYFRTAPPSLQQQSSEGWQAVSERIRLSIDTSYQIIPGEQLAFRGYLHSIDTSNSQYGKLMHSRGFFAHSYLTRGALITSMTPKLHPLRYQSVKIQRYALSRLDRLRLTPDDKALLASLALGERRNLAPSLRKAYNITGTAHLLAVSGLHVGFILILANLLFRWVVLFRYGHFIRNGLVILSLWGYAFMTGLAAPVIRAAIMGSFAQVALGGSVRGNGYNLTLGAATLMLAVHPGFLYDVSFQLSFCAVLSILFFYPRLAGLIRTRGGLLTKLQQSFAVALAAQIGTLPLVLYYFGNFPLAALLINPLVIFTAFLAIVTAIIWVLLPIGLFNGLCSNLITLCLRIQNETINWSAAQSAQLLPGLSISETTLWLLYGLLATVVVVIKIREERNFSA